MYTREEILSEMQRLGKEKGGKAPSEKELALNAGIKNYYWHKYWTKISDLQKEAGFSPNTFLKIPYRHDDLCKKFTSLIRELGKWPTKAEIEVKHNKKSDFPGSTIFYKNLGNIKDLANNILEYAKGRKYNDVIKICEEMIERYKDSDSQKVVGVEEKTHGWVYLIKHGRFNQYRIGQTTNILRRWKENKIELPEEPKHIHTIETVDPEGVEKYWLNRFATKKMNGDWFELTSADVKEFRAWRKIV